MSDVLEIATAVEADLRKAEDRRNLRERLVMAALPELIRGTGVHIGRAEVRAKLAAGAVDLADQVILKMEGDA